MANAGVANAGVADAGVANAGRESPAGTRREQADAGMADHSLAVRPMRHHPGWSIRARVVHPV